MRRFCNKVCSKSHCSRAESGGYRIECSVQGEVREMISRSWRSKPAQLVSKALFLVLWLTLPLAAQLNENCVVSVLNRNVSVNPDGTWVLPNIPANFGQVRARATCVQNGVTQSGQSNFFSSLRTARSLCLRLFWAPPRQFPPASASILPSQP